MSSTQLLRIAARARGPSSSFFTPSPVSPARRLPLLACGTKASISATGCYAFSTTTPRLSGDHAEETFEEFTARYENEFNGVQDVFELQRNLNNAFAYDLVPSPTVITAALRAARRVNDFPTAVRIFEGIKAKVENKMQYEEYLQELEPLREELGVNLKEHMYPDDKRA
ncbi:MAG: Cytochrome c oxidase subunit 6 [Bathelium mastoideum]|nr:MAG: Cytochrome c oxidase subunit 6 [Bathelium mastoideum]KAI9674926.1 MAG: Cytochrome c oxidase subunit 6 [Bathelium mastoideum]